MRDYKIEINKNIDNIKKGEQDILAEIIQAIQTNKFKYKTKGDEEKNKTGTKIRNNKSYR